MPSTIFTLTRGDETFVLGVEYEIEGEMPWVPAEGGEITDMTITWHDQPFEATDKEVEAIEQHVYETHDYSDYASYEEDTWSDD